MAGTMTSRAMPAITPPAISPVFGGEEEDGAEEAEVVADTVTVSNAAGMVVTVCICEVEDFVVVEGLGVVEPRNTVAEAVIVIAVCGCEEEGVVQRLEVELGDVELDVGEGGIAGSSTFVVVVV